MNMKLLIFIMILMILLLLLLLLLIMIMIMIILMIIIIIIVNSNRRLPGAESGAPARRGDAQGQSALSRGEGSSILSYIIV